MAERYADRENSTYLHDKDALFTDPACARVLESMAVYNDALEQQSLTQQEADSIMRSIDSEWGPIKDTLVSITGMLSIDPEQRGDAIEPSKNPVPCVDEHLFFRGAVPVVIKEAYDTETPGTKRYYAMQLLFARVFKDESGDEIQQSAKAQPRDIMAMYSHAYMSVERARALLNEYCPDLIEEIDKRLQTEELDETVSLLKLGDIAHDSSNIPEQDINLVRRALEKYVAHLVELDRECPYYVHVEGTGWAMSEENSTTTQMHLSETGLAHASKIQWILSEDPSTTQAYFTPHIALGFCGNKANTTRMQALVPIRSIKQVCSIRRKIANGDGFDQL